MRAQRAVRAIAAALALLGLAGCSLETARPPTVLLVVLDTVRRDRVQPCGEPRPTTPTLQILAELGTTFCNMVAPGSWTLPVHASIFSGRLPTAHGADFAPDGAPVPGLALESVSALPEHLPTLAERFREAGYQTVLVSGNPVLHPSIGLARGFDEVEVAPEFGVGTGADVLPALERILTSGSLDPTRPLFLFVNIAHAHGPFEPVPETIDWLPATGRVVDLFHPQPESLFWKFHTGQMTRDEEERFLDELRSVYDWGVRLADHELGRVAQALVHEAWLDDDSIVAVTSDHGEFLGEHRLLDHGRSVARENIDAFAVILGPGFRRGARSDALAQSQDLYPTLLSAAGLPVEPALPWARPLGEVSGDRVAVTLSEPDDFWQKHSEGRVGGRRHVAVQRDERRVVWSDGGVLIGEVVAGVAPSQRASAVDPELAALAREIASREVSRSPVEPLPEEVREGLRALGYGD